MKNLALALASCLLPAAASAQIRVAPTAGAVAWSGPIAAVAAELGMAGIAQLDSLSLPRLMTPGLDARAPIVDSPELLNPLAQTLADSAVDPVEFPSMPMEFKATILRTAASLTEERLGMKVWSVVQDTHKGIGRSAFSEVARQARQSRETSLYLNDRTLEGLVLLEERVRQFEAAREEASREFLQDLPAKLAAGVFNGQNLLQTEDDGGRTLWKTAGDSPERTYATPEAALDIRLEALALMPPGPWSVTEARLLKAALRHAMEAGTISPSRWTVSAHDALYEAEKAGITAENEVLATLAPHRIIHGGATAADLRAVEKFYADSHDRAAAVWPLRAKILAEVKTGGKDFPSWDRLQTAKREVNALLERLGSRAAKIGMAMTLVAMVLATGDWNPAFLAAALLSTLAPVLVLYWTIRERRGSRDYSRLARGMANYFSRKP